MSKEKILIVEDDKNISMLVKYNLEKAGFICKISITGEDALEILDREPIDLIILDVMLPAIDGFEICKIIKEDPDISRIPIIMLTARGEEIDRIIGFELGVDDYVVKPFSPRELMLRVKAILKRGKIHDEAKAMYSLDQLVVDIARHKVLVDKKPVQLTPMEFNLLVLLLQRKGRVQSRETLLEDVWDIASDVTTRTVDTHIKRLRQKLGKMGAIIETVRGLGYKIKDD